MKRQAPYPHNPWTDVNAWRELAWDIRHPVLFWRRAKEGLREGIRFIENGFSE